VEASAKHIALLPYCPIALLKRGIMPEQLIATAGIWFFAACAAAFAAVFVEQAGAARSPEEDGERKQGATLILMFASLLTPGLLLLHGFFLTHGAEAELRIWLMAAPVASIIVGSLLGAIVGAIARGAAPTMRKLALPLGFVALALTLFATSPSIVALVNSLQDSQLELPVHPV
jgi:hypothetical protein